MNITVTQADIDGGFQGRSNNCAIALALKRELKTDTAIVNGSHVFFAGGQHYKTTKKMKDFITKFDQSKTLVSPFTFALRRETDRRKVMPSYVIDTFETTNVLTTKK